MRCVLISWSKRLLKVTGKPPLHFSLPQFFQQATALGSCCLQAVPFDIQGWLLRGLNFLIRRGYFVSAPSVRRARCPQLGADRPSPDGCREKRSGLFHHLLQTWGTWGPVLYPLISRQLRGSSSRRYIAARSCQPHGGKFKVRQSLFQDALTGEGKLLVKRSRNQESWWLLPALARG